MATVEVKNLNYETPYRAVDFVDAQIEHLRPKLPKFLADRVPRVNPENLAIKLQSISFMAKPRELTAVISGNHGELRTISKLLGARTNYGTFDGHIHISGVQADTSVLPVAYVSRVAKDLYIPGLSYLDMLNYAARLRLPSSGLIGLSSAVVEERVKEVLQYMDLKWCKHRVIPERPSTRGELGGELRRLVVAVEIISLPKVVVLDDPGRDLDFAMSNHLFRRLKFLADSGYTVICAIPGATPATYKLFNKTVLISCGYSIYSGPSSSIKEYFTSPQLAYRFKDSYNPVEFLLDVSSGIERPRGAREAPTPATLQNLFESSPFFDENVGMVVMESIDSPEPQPTLVKGDNELNKIAILPDQSVASYGYTFPGIFSMIYKSFVVLERCFKVKINEREVNKKSLVSNTFLGIFIGYFAFETGDFGDYCTSLFGFPYVDTSNSAALCFMSAAVIMVQQVLNVHIICQKIRVFRYEQKSGAAPHLGFWMSTLISESLFAVFFSLIFGSILFLMTKLNDIKTMPFYIGVVMMTSVVGVCTTVMFASVFRSEILVRDLFLLCTFLMVFTAGFVFTLPTVRSDVRDISAINPLRWTFESLMVWKFEDVEDGLTFLESYGFESFEKEKIWGILTNFIIFPAILFFIALIPLPITLSRTKEKESSNRNRTSTTSVDSADGEMESVSSFKRTPSNTPRKNSKRNAPAAPLLFLRESSISGKKSTITSQHSHSGVVGEADTKGPTVIFSDLTYRVKDSKSPLGYRDLLHSVSGKFDWGKLGVIMGAVNAGKSTLLQVLGGVPVSSTTRLSGQIVLDNKPHDMTLQSWQRCAYVDHSDEHYRDLSVIDIVTYAMKLRCLDMVALKDIDQNVKVVIELLQLTEVANVKSKHLSPGALKRLSIAEELVYGPPFLLIDEPLTGLDPKDIAILMNVFREMVNQDRTVVATAHQPTVDVFHLFDTLLLLSKGRVIYMGPTAGASKYFSDSPRMQFNSKQYFNPAEFILDISACQLKNMDGEIVDAPTLELYFRSSDLWRDYGLILSLPQDDDDSGPSQKNKLTRIVEEKGYPNNSRDVDQSSSTAKSSTTDPLKTKLIATASFDMTHDDSSLVGSPLPNISDLVKSTYKSFRKTDLRIVLLHSKVILSRSFFALLKREKLVIGSLALHLFFAFLFWYIMGDSSEDTNPVIGFFSVSGLILIVANVQFGYYLFSNNEVFLKEHSRGLYSCFLYWLWAPIPYLVLRAAFGMVYGLVVVDLLNISKEEDTRIFFLLLTAIFIFASATVGESLICLSPDLRTVYSVIPGMALILFFFSGLMVKPSTLPDWTQSWLPSVSMVRWTSQALTINEFKNNDELFPTIFGYDTYEALLNLFGWGGKTKWECLYVVIYNVAFFRVISYFALLFRSQSQVGKRGHLKSSYTEDRLY